MKNQNEINLINFFTRNKNLTRVQQARFASIVARDCGENDAFNSHCENIDKCNFWGNIPRKNNALEYHSPRALQSFLQRYNQNPILKYTCHKIDTTEAINLICDRCNTDNYDFNKHVNLIIKEFDDLLKTCNVPVSKNMVALISAYLKGGNQWSSNRIDINWNHDSIKHWAKENPTKIPNPGENIQSEQRNKGFSLPKIFISNLTKQRIKDFGQLCIYFKSLFHIRFDNSLKILIEKNILENEQFKNSIDFCFSKHKFIDNIELFTDVDKLIQATKGIVNICYHCGKKISTKPQIEFSFYRENDHIIFTIHHKNSTYQKSAKDATRIGEEQMALIENQINGLANFYIEADFGNNEYGKINLWDGKDVVFTPSSVVTGVKYILEF